MDIIIYGLCATTDYVEDRILKEHCSWLYRFLCRNQYLQR